MTFRGMVWVVSGSTRARDGLRSFEAMPVFAFISRRSKMVMPVHSLPVPDVVGQAICGFRGPGIGCPPPMGALT